MRNLFYTILLFVCAQQVSAQHNNRFDYQIQRVDSVNYELNLQFTDVKDVQFIQIKLLEREQEFKIMEASLNRKRDGEYYFFLEGNERKVQPEDIIILFDQHIEGLNAEVVYLEEPKVIIDLIDNNLTILESLEKVID